MGLVKILGYIIMILGLFAISLTFSEVSTALNINLPEFLTITYLTIIGVVLIIVGAILARVGPMYRNKAKGSEVPIYRGREVVGYRRH